MKSGGLGVSLVSTLTSAYKDEFLLSQTLVICIAGGV
jgi:hypothetical protein